MSPAQLKEIDRRARHAVHLQVVVRQGEPQLRQDVSRARDGGGPADPRRGEAAGRRAGADRRATRTTSLAEVAAVVDVLQTPAFLCRQTDFIQRGRARRASRVNIKKGQFLAPGDMKNVVAKARAASGTDNILVCERGASFGYNNLVSDMRCARDHARHRLPGGVRRDALGAAAGRAGHGLGRAARVHAGARARRGRGRRRRRLHGDAPGSGRRRCPTGRTRGRSAMMQALLETLVELDAAVSASNRKPNRRPSRLTIRT